MLGTAWINLVPRDNKIIVQLTFLSRSLIYGNGTPCILLITEKKIRPILVAADSRAALCATYFIIRRAMIQTEWSRRILQQRRRESGIYPLGSGETFEEGLFLPSRLNEEREERKEERRGIWEFQVKRLVATFRFLLRNAISRLFNTDRGNRSALPGKRVEEGKRESESSRIVESSNLNAAPFSRADLLARSTNVGNWDYYF